MKMYWTKWPMDRNPLCVKEMYPLLIAGVTFWSCKDKSLCLFFLSLWCMQAQSHSPLVTHTQTSATEAKFSSQSFLNLPFFRYTWLMLGVTAGHANLLSVLVAFLKAAMNKGESAAFPSAFSVICSFFKLILSHAFFFFSLSPFPWEGGSFGHSSNFQHIQRTRVYPQKPNTSPLVKIAQLTVKFQSS